MKIKAHTSKRFLLSTAIRHYLKPTSEIYRFMSLYDDNEPYPLVEVIELLKERILELEELNRKCPCDNYQLQILGNRQTLAKLEKLQSNQED